ncbi:PH domain-containing protein [Candidatus Uhrbacteria bacterium]|nr:PH domain-containing protein [Candidatus Uhrbacteria bacterium]
MNISTAIHLKDGERVIRVVRHYFLVYVPKFALAFALVAAPIFFLVPLMRLRYAGPAIAAASIGIGAIYALRLMVMWYWNAFVITNQRIMDIDQQGFFERVVSVAPLERIQDVSYAIRGFWGTVFRYGMLGIQTAGTATNLELQHVYDPKEAHHLITELMAGRAAEVGDGRASHGAQLIEAAASMNDAEARAFLVTLQDAVRKKGSDPRMNLDAGVPPSAAEPRMD